MTTVPTAPAMPPKKKDGLWENLKAILWAVLLAFVIRSFVVEPFKIPSSSMVPTLLVGDHIFVNKFHYGLRIPFTKWWPVALAPVGRGEVVVFIYPVDESLDFIKRVIGLPGDEIRVVGHDVYINGQLLRHDPVAPSPEDEDRDEYVYYQEWIGERSHLVRYDRYYAEGERRFTVPPDSFFVMGDNRNNSQDSREWGTVPFANLKGKAMFIWISRHHGHAIWRPDGIRWRRFGDAIH